MTFNKYQEEAVKTAIYKTENKIIYPALGLASEAGEVLSKIKKVLRDNNGVFDDEVKKEISKECGDVLWYLAVLLKDIGYNFDGVAIGNLVKLKSRQERGVLQGSGDNR